MTDLTDPVSIRNAILADLDAIAAVDEVGPEDGEERKAYWCDIFERYVSSGRKDRFFLVAEAEDEVVGFITGEVRAWEFGSPPCGWVFTLAVSSKVREKGVGQQMFQELCKRLKEIGVTTVRTMVDRDDKLVLSFFRSQGLRTGQYVELEKQIE